MLLHLSAIGNLGSLTKSLKRDRKSYALCGLESERPSSEFPLCHRSLLEDLELVSDIHPNLLHGIAVRIKQRRGDLHKPVWMRTWRAAASQDGQCWASLNKGLTYYKATSKVQV